MAEENLNQEFRLKNIDETRNYFIKQNELMSRKHKKVGTTVQLLDVVPFLLLLLWLVFL